jgi:hypothetical protein
VWAYVWALQLASSSGNTKYFHLRKGSKEITGDREMVRWDIKGYIGIPLSFTKKILCKSVEFSGYIIVAYGGGYTTTLFIPACCMAV